MDLKLHRLAAMKYLMSAALLVVVGCGLELQAGEESPPNIPANVPSSASTSASPTLPAPGLGDASVPGPAMDAAPDVTSVPGPIPSMPDATSPAPQYAWRCSTVARPRYDNIGTCLYMASKLCSDSKPNSECNASDNGETMYANCGSTRCNGNYELLSTAYCTCTVK
jgi:hypothetical protein